MPLHRLLALTDFAQPGDHAIERAAALAARSGARLQIAFSAERTPVGDPIPRLGRRARQLARRHGIAIEALPRPLAADDVLDAARDADLLVTAPCPPRLPGWPPREPVGRWLDALGRPVLVVKQPAAVAWSRVAVPLDLSAESALLLQRAGRLAGDAQIEALHVVATGHPGAVDFRQPAVRERRRDAVARLRRVVAELDLRGARVLPTIAFGEPAAQILERQRTGDARLLVVGHRRRSWLAAWLGRSLGLELARQAGCDVLLQPLERVPALVAPPAGVRQAFSR